MAGLEESLIRADMGVAEAQRLAGAVAKNRYDSRNRADAEVRAILAGEIAATPGRLEKPLAIDGGQKPFVILVAGVNGTGKTTTIGKLARRFDRGGQESRCWRRATHSAPPPSSSWASGRRAPGPDFVSGQAGRRCRGPGLRGAGKSPSAEMPIF